MDSEKGSNFLDHLEALRNVLLKSAGCFLLFCIPAWYYAGDILQLIVTYAAPEGFKLHYFTIMEPFFTLLKITLILALTASAGASTMMFSVYCPSLKHTGMVSAATGFLDFVSYAAAALANQLFSGMVTGTGWGRLILIWAGLMACGIVVSLPRKRK